MRVSVVITCRDEGLLLAKAIASAQRAIAATDFIEDCEVLLVADRADAPTRACIEAHEARVHRVLDTDFGDLGLARNAAGEAARGDLLLFLDADDLWCRDWVGSAWAACESAPPFSVLHPRYTAFFGARSEFLLHVDWRDPGYDPRALTARNYWTSACGVRRALLRDNPFPAVRADDHFGFEDWSWYARLVAGGVRHVTVPGTIHFVRLKAIGSMQKAMNGFFPVPSEAWADFLAADDPARPYDL